MLHNLSVKSKLAYAFSVLTVIVVGISINSIYALNQSRQAFNSYLEGVNARANVAAQLRAAVDRRAIAARNIVLVTTASDLALEKTDVVVAHSDVQAHLTELKRLVARPDASDQARALVSRIDEIEQAYAPVATAILELENAGRRDAAIAKMNAECRPLLAKLTQTTDEYAALTRQREAQIAADYDQQYVLTRNIQLGRLSRRHSVGDWCSSGYHPFNCRTA